MVFKGLSFDGKIKISSKLRTEALRILILSMGHSELKI